MTEHRLAIRWPLAHQTSLFGQSLARGGPSVGTVGPRPDGLQQRIEERRLTLDELPPGPIDRGPLDPVDLGKLPDVPRSPRPFELERVARRVRATSRSPGSAHTLTRLPPGWRVPRGRRPRPPGARGRPPLRTPGRPRRGDPRRRGTPPSGPTRPHRPSAPRTGRPGGRSGPRSRPPGEIRYSSSPALVAPMVRPILPIGHLPGRRSAICGCRCIPHCSPARSDPSPHFRSAA